MIVPMKKVTLIALAAEQNEALSGLRDLGVMQIEKICKGGSENALRLAEACSAGAKCAADLEKFAARHGIAPGKESGPAVSGGRALGEGGTLLAEYEKLSGELEQIRQRSRALAVWGDFDRTMFDALAAKGIRVRLCAGTQLQFEAAQTQEGVELCSLIAAEGSRMYFAVVGDVADGVLPEIRLGQEDDPVALRRREKNILRQLGELEKSLAEIIAKMPAVRRYLAELTGELEFAQASDTMAEHGEVVSLTGFVPAPEVENVRSAAKANGWGVLITDPAEDDAVPTLLKKSKFSRLISPLFDFLGIAPGYHEIDVSAAVLVFFTIFYAMIIGDAGYGMIFLALTLTGMWKFRAKAAAKLPLRMLLVLSIATILWGVLTNNYFGVGAIPALGLECLTGEAVKDANVQAFCFILAVAQLSLGRIWRAVHDGDLRGIGRNIGWMLILWGNFFLTLKLLVWPGDFPVYMYWLYGAGLLLVVLCDVDWKNPGDIFQFPFNVISSFVDILSYIRLFAVGMAGFYIASSFNDMGVDIWKGSPWFLVFGALVILFGHLLNIGLCVLSVLVHGVRLNTLEFSNHAGLSWSGSDFKPFKNNNQPEE